MLRQPSELDFKTLRSTSISLRVTQVPTKHAWLLGFSAALLWLELFFIWKDNHGLFIFRSVLRVETMNIAGGCILTPHNPVIEQVGLGCILSGVLLFARQIFRSASGRLKHRS
jgi:hypothetical protein